jgi:hypothetical protein
MAESEQFAAHATRFRTEAEEATLDNVRDRCLRAAAAWESRAVSARRTETSRAQREAATAAARTLLQDVEPAAMPAPMPHA